MHPNAFLRTFWRAELRPQVFVAMSFDQQYEKRFAEVIAPAIRQVDLDGIALEPFRVDLSKTGDSILTDIVDGIAHSQMIVADVSTIGKDSKTGSPYRNANVMYEVGIALACRHSSEVLLVRDDHDKFLFDVSTVPHMTLDFTETSAKDSLSEKINERLKERKTIEDARVKTAIMSLTLEDINLIKKYSQFEKNALWGRTHEDVLNSMVFARLLNMQLIRVAATVEDGGVVYVWTDIGWQVAQAIDALPQMRQAK